MEGITGSISLGNLWQSKHIENCIQWYQRGFCCQKVELLSISHKRNLDSLHLKDFLKYECEMYVKQPLTPPQRKIIGAYCTSNHRLAIEMGRWTTIPISRDDRLCHFGSFTIVIKEAHFVLECTLYSLIGDKFPSLIENAILGSLESFF